MQPLESVLDIVDQYDTFIIDQWGVLHDGYRAYPKAVDVLTKLREKNKEGLILSNSSKRSRDSAQLCQRLHVPLFFTIVTSGEVLLYKLRERSHPYDVLGNKPFVFGKLPPSPGSILRGLPKLQPVSRISDASFLLALTVQDQTLKSYDAPLREAADMGLVMVLGNADYTAMLGKKVLFCPGELMRMYQKLGGETLPNGKPYATFYENAIRLAGLKMGRVLCIGDSPEHDVKGAHNIGADSLLITQGILQNLVPKKVTPKALSEALADRAKPTYYMDFLQ